MAKLISCNVCGHGKFEPKPTKNGGYSANCPMCGTQIFARSPKAAGFLSAVDNDNEPAPPKKSDDILAGL